MTTLAIMATYEKKRLKCYGTVAAGEHVAVTVTDGAQWIGEGKALRLRVLFGPDTVGVFPFADGDAWTATGTQNADAACELNLNTLQAEKYLKHGGTCLWILDDVENHTLYATGKFDVLPWPKRRGIDEPIDLDGYPLLLDEIKDLKEAFEEYQRTVAQMLATKQDTIFDLATIRSGAAAGATAVQPSQIARFVDDAEYKAQYGEQNKPAILFKHGTDVIVALDATPFVKDGMVSSVAVVGGNLVITFNTDSGKQPISIPLTDIFDPDNYYTKTDVNGLLAGKQDALTFDNAPTSGSDNPVKSDGIWSALWGALSALPTGFSSLYDWCVDQLAGKLDKSGGTMTGNLNIKKTSGASFVCVESGTRHVGIRCDSTSKVIETEDYDFELPANDGTLALAAPNPTAGNLAALDADGNPTDSGKKLSDKLDATSAAAAFSPLPTRQYEVGDHCTYNGKLYTCVIPTTGGTWVSSCWGTTQLIKPPVLMTPGNLASFGYNTSLRDSEIPAANVAVKGNIPYDRITITTGQLQDHAEQKVTLNAATTTLSLPALTDLTGKVSDFGIDMVNAYAPEVGGTPTPTAASFQLAGTIGTDYNLIVPDGETWSDMTALAPNEMAIYYFTLSAFQIGELPTWGVTKQVVTPVPVPVAP